MKIKLATIVGTRPEIIKLSQIIKKCDSFFEHKIIHTGQNYDYELNQIFFDDLEIRKPDFFLEVNGKNLGESIGNVISKTYNILESLNPDCILILGDTNSCLSAISAKRLKIPIFHLEAGNRCFDQNVPEEINRKIVDHVSDINLTYTENARKYLLMEGIRKDFIFNVGSPMMEILKCYNEKINSSEILDKLKLNPKDYIVVSVHREENLDLEDNFNNILNALNEVLKKHSKKIIFSTHPRTRKKLEELDKEIDSDIIFIKPLGFFDYINLQVNAFVTLSDSGTLAEESALLMFPAVSLRNSTERPEAIDSGSMILGSTSENIILKSIDIAINLKSETHPRDYDSPDCSNKVVKIIQGYTSIVNSEVWKK